MSEDAASAMKTFADEIADLCRKHGVGLEGATVYLMDADDQPYGYVVDEDSQLVRQ